MSATTLKRSRSQGLPTASSMHSFSAPPYEDWNKVPVFPNAERWNHASDSLFFGPAYHMTVASLSCHLVILHPTTVTPSFGTLLLVLVSDSRALACLSCRGEVWQS